MEAGYRTPLLDSFKRGEVPFDIRLMAANGGLAPRAHEQLALLVLLTRDSEPEIRAAADATIERIPRPALAAFLARSDVSNELREFFGVRGIEPSNAGGADEDDQPFVDAGGLDEEDGLALFQDVSEAGESVSDEPRAASATKASADGESGVERDRLPVVQRLAQLTVAGRLKRALKGTREERAVLIHDRNRLVASTVLSSPKVTESEIESYARMTGISEDVLRIIGTSRAWTKNYGVIHALSRNPKTPIALAMTFIPRLIERDVRMLAADRNVSEPVRIAARKAVMTGEARRR